MGSGAAPAIVAAAGAASPSRPIWRAAGATNSTPQCAVSSRSRSGGGGGGSGWRRRRRQFSNCGGSSGCARLDSPEQRIVAERNLQLALNSNNNLLQQIQDNLNRGRITAAVASSLVAEQVRTISRFEPAARGPSQQPRSNIPDAGRHPDG